MIPGWFKRVVLALVVFLALSPIANAAGPICAACGHEIGPGRYLQDKTWNECYHVEHANIPRCIYCGRGISEYNTRGGVHYPDGRNVCNLCQATAVVDNLVAASVEAKVRAQMNAWGMGFDYGAIPVRLVDQDTLERLFNHGRESSEGKLNGLTTKRWTKDGRGKVVSREVTIDILYGLPMEVYEKTIAHELMHAWMFLDHQPEHSPALEEGTCNLVSYYWLQQDHGPLAGVLRDGMYKNTNPVYGAGLRRAITYVQGHQFTGMVKMLRSSRDFPAGY